MEVWEDEALLPGSAQWEPARSPILEWPQLFTATPKFKFQ